MQISLLNIHVAAGKQQHCFCFGGENQCCWFVNICLSLLTFELSKINTKCAANSIMLTKHTYDSAAY